MPKVSVIIPTYNRADYLQEAIESVLAQTCKDFEIIIIDDGSTDNTKEMAMSYLDRIMFFEVAHGGPSKARNHGIRKSSGEYVAFLDADDIWYPDKLERQLDVFSKNQNYQLVYTDAAYTRTYSPGKGQTYFSIRKRVKAGWIFSELLSECFIYVPSVIVKRDCLERVGLFDEHLKWWEGYDLWLRIAFENQVGLVNAPLFFRRIHDSNLFHSDPINESISLITVMKKWEDKALSLTEVDRKRINRRLRASYYRLCAYYAAERFPAEARLALKKSFAHGFSLKGSFCIVMSIFPFFVSQWILKANRRIHLMTRGKDRL